MKRVLLAFLALAMSSVGLSAQESRSRTAGRKADAACDAIREASALSIMGWGLAITVGIATLFSLLDNNTGGGSSSH